MGSEKSVTQAGNGNGWEVENNTVGVKIGVGVGVEIGVMDGTMVNGLFGPAAGSARRSPAPHANIKITVLNKKKKCLISFIFLFLKS